MEEILLEITNKLGIATEQGFNIYTEAQPVQAMVSMFGLLLLFVGIYIIYKMVTKYAKSLDEEDQLPFIIITMSISFLFLVLCIDLIHGTIVKLLCPEYSAIKELISVLR